MTIAETLLPKLSEWEPSGSGRQSCSQGLADTGWALHLTADRVDTLGCLVWELTLIRANSDSISNAVLKENALKTAGRVTGLMEPLRFLELDETRCAALLRSEAPTKRSTALAYYEVLMTAGRQIQIRRFQVANDRNHREQVAFPLTHEGIAKLVDDLVRA